MQIAPRNICTPPPFNQQPEESTSTKNQQRNQHLDPADANSLREMAQ